MPLPVGERPVATWSRYCTVDRSTGRIANYSGSGRGSRRARSTTAAAPATGE